MHQKKIVLSVAICLILGLTELKAQDAIPATGGEASGSGGSISYTIGQIANTTNFGSNGSVAPGVQQPFEISVVSSIDEGTDINLICTAYPNPTMDLLTLKIDASTTLSIQSLSYQLYDITGKLLENKQIEINETSINMNNLVPAIYFLKVTNINKALKTFKIIKN